MIYQMVVCAAIQRGFDRLEKWAEKSLTNFSQGKCKVLHLGRKNPTYQNGLAVVLLESSFMEKVLRVLGDTKPNTCQQLQKRRPPASRRSGT